MNKDYFHIPDTSDMIPLTLEQYNALDGNPVIVEKNTMKKWWEIAHSLSGDTCGYGRFWWAYAYPPAHIDREAWKASWIDLKAHPGWVTCPNCGFNTKNRTHFCPHCGQPTDDYACDLLEKRLRG